MSYNDPSDLRVEKLSDSLVNSHIDVVVSGSIGAVEAPRFLRALRRLGAEVTPWLTKGGAQFTTPVALSWASTKPVRTQFSEDASHIAQHDLCVVAPASANFINSIALGLASDPAKALVLSYFGQKKPVFILPNMHESMWEAPATQKHVETLKSWGAHFLTPRLHEGKLKFASPDHLADVVSHTFRHNPNTSNTCLLSMGTTRGYIDDVRYLSNYSSGKLGSLVAEELYRQGMLVYVVCGPCIYTPRTSTETAFVETTSEMAAALEKFSKQDIDASIMAASVLDFEPQKKQQGKLASKDYDHLQLTLVKTPKILANLPSTKVKIAFKLEVGADETRLRTIAEQYIQKYELSALICNNLEEVDSKNHQATIFEKIKDSGLSTYTITGKTELAKHICNYIRNQLN